ncbi:unnamed protein product, partial [Meganyctiphanes norvegica]
MARLVYDSVSLTSHILRANAGIIRLLGDPSPNRRRRRRRREVQQGRDGEVKNNKESEIKGVPTIETSPHQRTEVFLAFPSSKSLTNEKVTGSFHRGTGRRVFISTSVQERDRLYFDMKKLEEGRYKDHIKLGNELELNFVSSGGGMFNRLKKGDEEHIKTDIDSTLKTHTRFPSFSGDSAFVSASGEGMFDFVLLDWLPLDDEFKLIFKIKSDENFSTKVLSEAGFSGIDWAGNMEIPRDPICQGGAPCADVHTFNARGIGISLGYVAMIVVCLFFLICACTAFTMFIRKHLRLKEMSRGPYKILLTSADLTQSSLAEITSKKVRAEQADRRPDLLQGSYGDPEKIRPQSKLTPTDSRSSMKDYEDPPPKTKYNGDFVHVKYLVTQSHFEVTNKTMSLLKKMHDLRHENVNGFVGMLTDSAKPGFIFEYCPRKSLYDIIRKDDIKLDWSFKLSLLTDLVRGIRYIHQSPLRHHGRLTSRNCVIDGRWVLKIADYGLPMLYDAQSLDQTPYSNKDLLWKAPELLRDEQLLEKGTQQGDVFSFSIIMQEVVVRGEPYCMVQMTPQEILARLKKPPPMIRPSVSKGAAPPDAINIMKQCWSEIPIMRPDFNQIYELFKRMNQGRRYNIVDTMFQMLEKYSSNLEDLVKDRTDQLVVEKKKTEQLLNRMLPTSIADQLKQGVQVEPEEFEEATIYFSDIVGFTTLSAYSTPFEVVDLLNDLYTAFDKVINYYNVYKVETIGDAYMVVGGVPKYIPDHAAQIASMALDLLHLSGKFRIRHLHNIPIMLRIGIHTGPCCAGVVGMTMPRYCLFGDTVNTASRMESLGSAWRIHISEATAVKLREAGGYQMDYRGLTPIKGKGQMHTFWLLGKDGFTKPFPTPPPIGKAHGLEEELLQQGRLHYMSRRDSSIDTQAFLSALGVNMKGQGEDDIEEESLGEDLPPSRIPEKMLNMNNHTKEENLVDIASDNLLPEEVTESEFNNSTISVSDSTLTSDSGKTSVYVEERVIHKKSIEKNTLPNESSATLSSKSESKSNIIVKRDKESCGTQTLEQSKSDARNWSKYRSSSLSNPSQKLHPSLKMNLFERLLVINPRNENNTTQMPYSKMPDSVQTKSPKHKLVRDLSFEGKSCNPKPSICMQPEHINNDRQDNICYIGKSKGNVQSNKSYSSISAQSETIDTEDISGSLRCSQSAGSMQGVCSEVLPRSPRGLRGIIAQCQVHEVPSPTESTML